MEKKEFSKQNTLFIKGIAIIMMMLHHCFRSEDLFAKFNVSFFPISKDFIVQMSDAFKICVSIFAFLTGYGLIISLKKLNDKYEWSKKDIVKWIISRLVKLLSGFWIIAILAYVICEILSGRTTAIFFNNGVANGILRLIINFFGLSNIFGLHTYNSTWWYMSIAVIFVFAVPLFAKMFKKYGYIWILAGMIFIPRIFSWNFNENGIIIFLIPVLIGMIFGENNLLVKIANWKIINNKYINKFLKLVIETVLVILFFSIYRELNIKTFYEIKYALLPTIFIIYLYEFFADIPVIKQIFEFLGKYSMDLFLIHTFIRSYYLNEFIYSFGNWIKIILVLLGISLAISIVLELFKKLIKYDNLIKKLSEKLSNKVDKIYSTEN